MDINWIAVAQIDDIAADTRTLRVAVQGKAVCLYRLDDDEVCATQDLCTHGNASLAEGYVEDGVIECPLHQGTFDIRTGKAQCAPAAVAIKVYRVKVDGETVFVDGGET